MVILHSYVKLAEGNRCVQCTGMQRSNVKPGPLDLWGFPSMGDPKNGWFTMEHITRYKIDDSEIAPILDHFRTPPWVEVC